MRFRSLTLLLAALFAAGLRAQLPAAQQQQVATIAKKILADTGVPSASVAIVQGGRVTFAEAYGRAHIAPDIAATASMAYPIGSVTKQFTASAVLLLVQEGKMSLDDKVARWFPEFTRATDVSMRNLLTMTSGYEDFAPQDYIIPAWMQPTEPYRLAREWATKPLDFEPGTENQYSNTNYVIVALIIEKVSGMPYGRFMAERVLKPAGVRDVINTYNERAKLRVTGYVSVALQPVREQPLEGAGWYFGDGDLAMPASSLAQWDICMMTSCLLSPASYKEQQTSFRFVGGKTPGADSRYGLGIYSTVRGGVHIWEHSGEVGGFVSENIVFPDQQTAVVVLTNEVASEAASAIAHALTPLVLGDAAKALMPAAPAADAFAEELKGIVTGLGAGKIDRTLFTADCNTYFDALALADFQRELAPLGAVTKVERTRTGKRGGMDFGVYRVSFADGTALNFDDYRMPDGKIEQLLLIGKG